MNIKTALISVSDKSGLADLARALKEYQVTIYSTGGTAEALREHNIEVVDISALTGADEILDGRVKTLRANIHAGILADRDNPEHLNTLKAMNIPAIDLVVVNFYPFEKISSSEQDEAAIIENIDIGGPTMARAAAKNFKHTAALTDPQDYPAFISELYKNKGEISARHLKMLATKAFIVVAHLDAAIANYFCQNGESFPSHQFIHLHKQLDLKYGENPHQAAACYEVFGGSGGYVQLQGSMLSYNNFLDTQAACDLISLIEEPAAVIIKHNNPCGAAVAEDIRQAFYMARRCDSTSAFGGVVGVNREVDEETAEVLTSMFLEVIIAPRFSAEAKKVFAAHSERLRLLLMSDNTKNHDSIRSVGGFFLAQTTDSIHDDSLWKVVSESQPTPSQWRDLRFAWKVAMVVKSNAIVIAKDNATIGIGAGQMSRVDSVRLAHEKAKRAKFKLTDTVAASDAFFPFMDGVEELAKAGVLAIIQPGGSKNDNDIIAVANEHKIAMVFTQRRHFKH